MATTEPEVVTGELVPVDAPGPPTLFGTSDPQLALQRQAEIAKALVGVIRDRKLVVRINGREHLTAEAWQTLGGMLGIVPVVTWTRPLEDGTGWEARVEARTIDGRIVGGAESMCTRSEQAWKRRDEYALRSMSQTRAISRALRAPLSQIVKMAGYDPTGAEEMPQTEPQTDTKLTSQAAPVVAKPEQRAEIGWLITRLTELRPETDWKQQAREITAGPPNVMTVTVAKMLIEKLRRSIETAEEFESVAEGES